jgi:hypothetical protein
MSRPDRRDERSHGEAYPGSDPDGGSEDDRYGARREPPQPDRERSDEPKPAAPPPAHERNS